MPFPIPIPGGFGGGGEARRKNRQRIQAQIVGKAVTTTALQDTSPPRASDFPSFAGLPFLDLIDCRGTTNQMPHSHPGSGLL